MTKGNFFYETPSNGQNYPNYGYGFTYARSSRVWEGGDYPKMDHSYKPRNPSVKWSYPSRPVRRETMTPHAYTCEGYRMVQTLLGLKYSSSGGPVRYGFDYFGSEMPNTSYYFGGDPWTVSDDLALNGKIREEVAGSDFNPAVFLGEGKQSLETIADVASKLARAILLAKKGNIKGAMNSLGIKFDRKQASNDYLQLIYGILPMLDDVEGAARFLAYRMSAPVFRVTASRSARGGGRYTNYTGNLVRYTYGSYLDPYYGYIFRSVAFKGTTGKRSKRIVAYLKTIDNVGLSGLLSPEQVVWELVPLSFVVDWFIPIGNYLDSLALSRTLKGTFVTSSLWKVEASGPFLEGSPGFSIDPAYSGSGTALSYYRLDRSVSTSVQVPTVGMKSLADVPSFKRASVAVALLLQRR